MNRSLRCLVVFIGCAALVSLVVPQTMQGQDKKDKTKVGKTGPVIEATDKAGKNWGGWQAKTGIKILTDKTYLISALPKEMVGSTFVTRESPELGRWFPDAAVKAKSDLTVYAMVQTKARGKETFDEAKQQRFVKEGWKEVEGRVGTTFPTGEGWEWKAYKTDIDEGDVYLQLKDLSWDKHGAAVLFFFKAREKAKDKP